MRKLGNFRMYFIILLCMILFSANNSTMVSAQDTTIFDNYRVGPKLDKVVFSFVPELSVRALLDDEVDIIPNILDNYLEENANDVTLLDQATSIETVRTPKNGYGAMVINCAKYPFNITVFRRALAFAIDKETIASDHLNGLAQPLDSCVPRSSPFSIEGTLSTNYYGSDFVLAEQMLDEAGIIDYNEDGFRDSPNGSDLEIVVNSTAFSWIAYEVTHHTYETLVDLGFNASSVVAQDYEYHPPEYYFPLGDFDLTYVSFEFNNTDVDWLGKAFSIGDGLSPSANPSQFYNDSFLQWRTQLLYGISYEEVLEAAEEMQKIWIYECPMIVFYELDMVSAYRTDKFNGITNHYSKGVSNWWTAYSSYLQDEVGGPFGGTLRFMTDRINNFNPMIESSSENIALNLLYNSLLRINPEGEDEIWVAKNWIVEYHSDNPDVENGRTRITFEIFQDIIWSDGTLHTAEDISSSINYYLNHPEIPTIGDLSDVLSVVSLSETTLRIEFATESYWNLHKIAYLPILPRSVLLEIGEQWDEWNPNPPFEPMITSGSFNVSDIIGDEYLELTYNPDFFMGLCNCHSWYPHLPYESEFPTDIEYVEGSIGNSITWELGCTIPYKYELHNGTSLPLTEYWNGGFISYNVDGLDPGVYNFTIVAYSAHFISLSDSVNITVISVEEYQLRTLTSLILVVSSIAFVFAISIVLCKRRSY